MKVFGSANVDPRVLSLPLPLSIPSFFFPRLVPAPRSRARTPDPPPPRVWTTMAAAGMDWDALLAQSEELAAGVRFFFPPLLASLPPSLALHAPASHRPPAPSQPLYHPPPPS